MYNGYVFGRKLIYNPWWALNYSDNEKMDFMPYWINNSSNDLIKKLLIKSNNNVKLELEELIEGILHCELKFPNKEVSLVLNKML